MQLCVWRTDLDVLFMSAPDVTIQLSGGRVLPVHSSLLAHSSTVLAEWITEYLPPPGHSASSPCHAASPPLVLPATQDDPDAWRRIISLLYPDMRTSPPPPPSLPSHTSTPTHSTTTAPPTPPITNPSTHPLNPYTHPLNTSTHPPLPPSTHQDAASLASPTLLQLPATDQPCTSMHPCSSMPLSPITPLSPAISIASRGSPPPSPTIHSHAPQLHEGLFNTHLPTTGPGAIMNLGSINDSRNSNRNNSNSSACHRAWSTANRITTNNSNGTASSHALALASWDDVDKVYRLAHKYSMQGVMDLCRSHVLAAVQAARDVRDEDMWVPTIGGGLHAMQARYQARMDLASSGVSLVDPEHPCYVLRWLVLAVQHHDVEMEKAVLSLTKEHMPGLATKTWSSTSANARFLHY